MNISFYNGVSGMKAHQYGIDLLSDNIANVNTAGYRSTSVEFSTIFSQQLSGSLYDTTNNDIGLGARAIGTSTNFNTGSIVDSDNKYDMVIEGDGWFGVKDHDGEMAYTRAGQFSRDANSHLVDINGNYVTGTLSGNVVGNSIIQNPSNTIVVGDVNQQEAIHLPDDLTILAEPTTFVDFKGPLDPTLQEEFNVDLGERVEVANKEVYRTDLIDSDGNLNKLDLTFTKSIPQATSSTTWSVEAILNDPNGNPLNTEVGELSFDGRGALVGNTLTSINNNGTDVALDFGTFYDPNVPNSGFDGLVSLSGLNSSREIEKDGNLSGYLTDYGMDANGNIQATFSNGKTVPIAKIAVYHFRNEAGLEKVGNTTYKESVNSGEAKFFQDANGNTLEISTIKNKKLEMSNLNITTGLTELIVMQKAFDASSRSITTSDEMIQNAINMKQ